MKKAFFFLIILCIPLSAFSRTDYIITLKKAEIVPAMSALSADFPGEFNENKSQVCMDDLCFLIISEEMRGSIDEDKIISVEENILYELFANPTHLNYSDSWSYSSTQNPSYEKGRVYSDSNTSGKGFVAAIFDAGFFNHEGSAGFLYDLGQEENCLSYYLQTPLEYKCADYDGHGTHVAGIIASVQGSTPYGTGYGKISIMPFNLDPGYYEYLDNGRYRGGYGYVSLWAQLQAFEKLYALKKSGVPIVAVNMSYGSPSESTSQYNAVKKLLDVGIIAVAAAGNTGDNGNPRNYPASYDLPNIVSVLALDPDHEPANYSSYGYGVTIGAPGSQIISSAVLFDTDDSSKILYDAAASATLDKSEDWVLSEGKFSLNSQDENYISDVITASDSFPDGSALYVYYEGNSGNSCTIQLYVWDNDKKLPAQSGFYCNVSENYLSVPIRPNTNKIKYIVEYEGSGILNNIEIKLTVPKSAADKQNRNTYKNGTSMAAPYVTGAITAAKDVFPTAEAAELLQLLYRSASKNESLEGKVVGNRELDMEAFIKGAAYCYLMGDACMISKKYPDKNIDFAPDGGGGGDNGGDDRDGEGIDVLDRINETSSDSNSLSFGCSMFNSGTNGKDLFLIAAGILLCVRIFQRRYNNNKNS